MARLKYLSLVAFLAAFSAFSYWRFIDSPAMGELVRLILEETLLAEARVGSHRASLVRPDDSFADSRVLPVRLRVELGGVDLAFLADGKPSGVSFSARSATAYMDILEPGTIDRLVFEGPEISFAGPLSEVARLGILRRRGSGGGVGRIELHDMAVSMIVGGEAYRVGGIDLDLDRGEGPLRISAELREIRLEGYRSMALNEEAPEIDFEVEIDRSSVQLRRLRMAGASGWKVEGEVAAELGEDRPRLSGEMQLYDLQVSRIYEPSPDVHITSPDGLSPRVRRTISFAGPIDEVRVVSTTDVAGFAYRDDDLKLSTEGVSLVGLRAATTVDLVRLFMGFFKSVSEDAGGA